MQARPLRSEEQAVHAAARANTPADCPTCNTPTTAHPNTNTRTNKKRRRKKCNNSQHTAKCHRPRSRNRHLNGNVENMLL